ncbi:cytochrome c oxidase subunit I [Tepidiforma thermophila]|uniref:Cytochrome c oxidase subunit 1 n=1 Tax=Tepidiforma thermophila (strain KCTC 52669 / CGMCC 1.13589 / G233) TaxID=2761530 RepID=A0A2A9HCI1_TEPT2|nr:cbb3-type cytochrome c oxidase subunit I [Tepidiforma thermophila]PFG73674.1 cytochrome c oxidase subunit 1 [Tepidiforma thermophila]
MYAVKSVFGALGLGLIGFYLGLGIVAFLRWLFGYSDPWGGEINIIGGWVLGLFMWLMGIGMWGQWGREWFGLKTYTRQLPGWQRYFTFNTDHKVIGIQYLVTFMVVFFLAGALAMLMRLELAQSGNQFLSNAQYNGTMGLHGILMVAVAVAAVIGGIGNYAVPLMIGAQDMAFPRLNALTFWLVPPVAVGLLATPFLGGIEHGWTAYPPLAIYTNSAQVLFSLSIITFGLTSILGALNFIVTIIYMRAPGLTWGRLPIFVWSMFATSWIALLYTQGFAAALFLVLLDRLGFSFFNTAGGGDPLLYQHVFWFYSHPAVYIMVLPGFGLALELIAHFSRKPLFAYRYAVAAFLGILGLSGVVWAHHMFTSGMPNYLHGPFLVATELISIPTGLIFLSALGTIWLGRLWLKPPMLFALAVIFNFACGGVTGIFLADVPTDIHLQDTYFVVAHFHYTIVGGEIFALFAAIYYYFPKMTGRMYSERLAKLHFWWMFIGFNATFFLMHLPGIKGMNRRIADFPSELDPVNLAISLAGFFLGASFLVFIWNMVYSWVRGPVAEANPWQARTLEWQTSSPPPHENFPVPPVVSGGPYDYGVPGSKHATFPVPSAGFAGAPAGGGGQ